MPKKPAETTYDSSNIQVLKGLEAVKKRPGMYIGDTDDGSGLHHMVFEVLDNCIDEAMAGHCSDINVIINKDESVTVKDNGRGVPVDVHKDEGISAAELILTTLHSGGKFDDNSYKVSGGLHGVGVSVVNALSDRLILKVCRDGGEYFQEYKHGVPLAKLKKLGASDQTGTEITFYPSSTTFSSVIFEIDKIYKRIQELSFLNAGVSINVTDERTGKSKKFKNSGGLSSYVTYLKGTKKHVTEIFECSATENDVGVEIALQWTDSYTENVLCYTNNIPQKDGGTHLAGFRGSLTRVLKAFIKKENAKKTPTDLLGEDVREGIVAIISVKVPDPKFSSQTKEKLITEVKDFGTSFEISKKMVQLILKSEIVNSILDWIEQKKNADENKLQRNLNKKLSKIKVEKLIDAKGKDRWKYSLGLFEGDSAAGAFRKYRDSQSMGAFALKGKFINVSDITSQKLVQNTEAVNLMASIGLKLGHDIQLKSLRYGRILLYVDADVDGNAIAALLINFFYKYWPDMFERSMFYKVETPIVVAIPRAKKEKKILFYNQTEYNEWEEKNDLKKYEIKYKKGLAALVDDEYQDIINSPRMTQITKDDVSEVSLDIWFGKNSDLRKNELLKNK